MASNSFATGVYPSRKNAPQTDILDVDSRLSRTFSIREKYNLMLAAESFNLMNHQNFTAFNTTAYAERHHGHLSSELRHPQRGRQHHLPRTPDPVGRAL